jgi:hypothetical protein
MPQSEEPSRQHSWAVDIEADRKNIEALYSSLKTTSAYVLSVCSTLKPM